MIRSSLTRRILRSPGPRPPRPRYSLALRYHLESLEDRTLVAVFVVQETFDLHMTVCPPP